MPGLKLEVDEGLNICALGLEQYPDHDGQDQGLHDQGAASEHDFIALIPLLGNEVDEVAKSDEEGDHGIAGNPLGEDAQTGGGEDSLDHESCSFQASGSEEDPGKAHKVEGKEPTQYFDQHVDST